MPMYQVKKVTYEEREFNPDDLMTMVEAADALDMSIPGVRSAIDRGDFTEIIDPRAKFHGKRLVLRSEVVARKQTN